MVHDDEKLDQLTGSLIKNSGTDEPGSNFTDNVMQSVFASKAPVVNHNKYNYLWSFLLVPALIGPGWYLSAFPDRLNQLLTYLHPLGKMADSVLSSISGFIQNLSFLSFSPFILIGSLAVLILLVIETLFSRRFQIR